MHFVIIPGIDGSDDDHWQSLWQAQWGPAASRISPSSWESPDLDDWCAAIDQSLAGSSASEVVLVAHSLGCLAAAEWISRRRPDLRGAFLVSPPDRAGPLFPAAAAPTFAAIATDERLGVPGLVVSSDDDQYCEPAVAERLATDWGVDRISVGSVGHINSASRLGWWSPGFALLTAFVAGTRR